MKIAMLFPYAPAYRGPVYELMDKELDIDWFFANNVKPPLKLYDYSRLKNCDLTMTRKTIFRDVVKYIGIDNLHLEKYDVIIAPSNIRNLSVWRILLRFGQKSRGPKIFFWTHGWYGRENRIESIIKRKFLSKADGIFVYNNRSCKLMEERGIESKRLFTIYNSLDYDTQIAIRNSLSLSGLYGEHFRNDNKNIVFIGRLTKVKRFDLLIEAVALLKSRGEYINITFIGDGVERHNMEILVKEKGLEKQVWFYGACYDERTNAELIYNADLCVSPGNIGLTVIHVMMFGCPAITHNKLNYQVPEYEAIHAGLTGAFFNEGDAISLSNCISDWFANHSQDREIIRDNCYKEIDLHWNPHYQLKVIKNALGI